MNLNDLETFVLVAKVGTFTGAAARLGVPKSTISRRVERLEAELGLALLTRASRSFVLSEDGRALYERCAPALREIADVARDLGDSMLAPRGNLRVTASIDLGTTSFMAELLAHYTRQHPDVQVTFQVTNRIVDLLEENIDIGFRAHVLPLPSRDDLVAKVLGRIASGIYAAPAYLEQHGTPQHTADLSQHRVVGHTAAHPSGWPEPDTLSLTATDFRPLAGILAASGGIGMVPDFVAAPHVRRGELVRVEMPNSEAPLVTLSLVWLRSRHLSPRLRAFIDMAVEHADARPWLTRS